MLCKFYIGKNRCGLELRYRLSTCGGASRFCNLLYKGGEIAVKDKK